MISALENLVHTTAEAPEDAWTMRVLAAAVADLERAAGASLGATDHDPIVVLQRRLGRVHGLLVAAPGAVSPGLVLAHLQALRRRAPTPGTVPAVDHLAHAC